MIAILLDEIKIPGIFWTLLLRVIHYLTEQLTVKCSFCDVQKLWVCSGKEEITESSGFRRIDVETESAQAICSCVPCALQL